MNQPVGEYPQINSEQRRQLAARYRLAEPEIGTLLDDLWLLTNETAESYIRRRHDELRSAGVQNDRGFAVIAEEVAAGRFVSSPLSLRQIRRIIYG